MRSSRVARVLGAAVASVAAAAVMVSTLVSPASAATEPLPGTATAQFFSGWLPYWRGSDTSTGRMELDRLAAHSSPDGFVGEINLFWAYSAYRGTEIQAPVCIHDPKYAADTSAQRRYKRSMECPTPALTAVQKNDLSRLTAAGIKTYLSFTDDSLRRGLASALAYQDPVTKAFTKRNSLIAAQVSFLVRNGIDGIDLDYEDFAFEDGSSSWATTKPAWIAYVTALSAALHAKGKKLSVTVPAEYAWNSDGSPKDSAGYWVYAWSDIIGAADRLRLMTYDKSWDIPGPIGPADWVDSIAASTVAQLGTANAHKVWLGVAAYGYDWATKTTCEYPSRPTRYPQRAWDIYAQAKAGLDGRSLVPNSYRYDTVKDEYTFKYAKSGTAANEVSTDPVTGLKTPCTTTEREVWFQDARSHVDRALIAAKYQLAGIAMWAFGDERDATWTSLTAAAPSIKPYRPTISLLASPQVTYGQVATAGVTVTRPDNEPVPAVSVTFRWKPAGSTTWSVVGTVLTDDTGTASMRFKPTSNGTWQATTPPAVGRQSGTSGTMPTTVRSSVATSVRSVSSTGYRTLSTAASNRVFATVKKGSAVQIAGRVLAARGQTATLLRKRPDGVYQVLTSVKVSSTGYYSFGVSTRTTGTYSYIVRSSATATLAKGQSALVLLTVS